MSDAKTVNGCSSEEVAKHLETAVLNTMNPSIDNLSRNQSYEILEKVRI